MDWKGSVAVVTGIGVAATADLGTEDLLQAADLAMYRAKRAGGDRVETVGVVHRVSRKALNDCSSFFLTHRAPPQHPTSSSCRRCARRRAATRACTPRW